MKVSCMVELNYDSSKQAEHVFESVQVDDASFMKTTVRNNIIQTRIQTSCISSMLHTVDDLLACVRVAEKITEKNE